MCISKKIAKNLPIFWKVTKCMLKLKTFPSNYPKKRIITSIHICWQKLGNLLNIFYPRNTNLHDLWSHGCTFLHLCPFPNPTARLGATSPCTNLCPVPNITPPPINVNFTQPPAWSYLDIESIECRIFHISQTDITIIN